MIQKFSHNEASKKGSDLNGIRFQGFFITMPKRSGHLHKILVTRMLSRSHLNQQNLIKEICRKILPDKTWNCGEEKEKEEALWCSVSHL